MRDLIGRTLGHYRIVDKIGEGGMGEVYRARDERLDRDVAIKVLRSEVAADPGLVRRFEREARAAAALDHPNILTIHEIATHQDPLFIVTELLEGETLHKAISAGTLTTRKAVEYAVQIANGLAAAHDKGITHRDLKPANLFLTRDGYVKILDFGLARLRPETPGTGDSERPTETIPTAPGTALGTVGYMAPEQVRGQPVDQRADMFAFGAVLYEMLSGQQAFEGDTPADTALAVLERDPAELTDVVPGLPPALAGVVARCLEKRPADRFSSARDVAFALEAMSGRHGVSGQPVRHQRWRWIAAAGFGIALVVAVALALRPALSGRHEPSGRVSPVRLAVLPFENLGPADDSHFVAGITDEVRGKLAGLAQLQVIARASSDRYEGTTAPLTQIAGELGVRYLVTGKVRWQRTGEGPSRVRVTPELVEVVERGPPVVVWGDAVDASLSDVFQVQADIAGRVASSLDLALGPDESCALAEAPTENLAAYDAFLRAEQVRREESAVVLVSALRAAELYERAVALDPGFALAWARLSSAYSAAYYSGDSTAAVAEATKRAAERALELAPFLPESRIAMAQYWRWVAKDNERAIEQIRLALERAPHSAELLADLAWSERQEGRWKDALELYERAAVLDPLSPLVQFQRGWTLLSLRRYREAHAAMDRAYALAPTNLESVAGKAWVLVAEGDLEGARAFLRTAAESVDLTQLVANFVMYGDFHWVLDEEWQDLLLRLGPAPFGGSQAGRCLALTHAHHLRGDVEQTLFFAEEARTAHAVLLADQPDDPHSNVQMGVALAYLGRREDALAFGRRGVDLLSLSRDALESPYIQLQMVRIHILLGEPEPALDLLEPLLEVPMGVMPGELRFDPLFDPLRDHPRFQALLEKYDTD
jgi:TolB-like protein/Flp pilus assembly protein TadD